MRDSTPQVLVLGAGYAGVLCANRVAARVGGAARVTLVSATAEFVDRIRLHEALAGRALPRRTVQSFLRDDVRFVEGRVDAVRVAERVVTVSGRDPLRFDAMVCALGSRWSSPVPGAREHAAGLAGRGSAERVAATLRTLAPGAAVTVLGGGLTGVEVATEVAEAWPALRVSLISSTLAQGLSEAGRDYVRATLRALGVTLVEGARATAVSSDAVTLSDGREVPSSVTVWAGGFVGAAPDIDADWPLDADGRVVVDADLGVRGCPGVFAAGDAAAAAPGMASMLRMACATAMPMGAHAAENVARHLRGVAPRPFQFGFTAQCVSLGRRRGLVQPVDARDQPRPWILTGRVAALVKESICRFVVGSLRLDGAHPGLYAWPRAVVAGAPALEAEVA